MSDKFALTLIYVIQKHQEPKPQLKTCFCKVLPTVCITIKFNKNTNIETFDWNVRFDKKSFTARVPGARCLRIMHQVVEVVGRVKCGLSYFFFFSFSFSCKRDGRFFASAAGASDALCSIHKNYPKVFARRSTWAVRPDWTILKILGRKFSCKST